MTSAMASAPTAGGCVNRVGRGCRNRLESTYVMVCHRRRDGNDSSTDCHAPNRPGTSTRCRDGAGAVRFRRRSRQPREHAQSRLATRVISAAPSESFGLSAAVPVAPPSRARGNDMSLTSYPCGSMLSP